MRRYFLKWIYVVIASFLLMTIFSTGGYASIKLDPIFTNNMVLQRGKPLPVWGTASAGERVIVNIGAQSKSTFAQADGAWRVTFDAMPPTVNTPFKVVGDNTLELKNVAIGDVYICAGQSNMEWPVDQSDNAQVEIAAANYPNIRLFTVPKKVAGTPQKKFGAPVRWEVCSSQTIGGFSAVSYFFGRELNKKLKVPIGLINASWGGVVAQAFVSQSTLLARDDLHDLTLQTEAGFTNSAITTLEKNLNAWWNVNDPGTSANWENPAFNDTGWNSINIPAIDEKDHLPIFNGVMWLRRTVQIPASWEGKDLTLNLGPINDHDTTYFNGQAVGMMYMWNQPRIYKIPGKLVKAGRAVIAVRFLDTGAANSFGFNQAPYLELAEDPNQKIEFSVGWRYQSSTLRQNLSPMPVDVRGNPNQPAVLFNGMIAPLLPFSVRGVIWYQGESDVANAAQYRTLFPELIRDWRHAWDAKQDGSEFGFYFTQISTYGSHTDLPVKSGWAELREAQTMALNVPRTAMAVTIDIGTDGYHPTNKQDVGNRLALAALAIEYGWDIEYSGPVFESMEIEGNKIHLHFSHTKGLKTVDGAAPLAFAIAGVDNKWVPADAKIEGENVILSSAEVADPIAVRYAWQNHPYVNLINSAGLPAVPFRTDVS